MGYSIIIILYSEQSKLDEAVKVLVEVLEIREKTNGREHQTVSCFFWSLLDVLLHLK